MTDKSKDELLAAYAELSVQVLDLTWEVRGWRGDPTTYTECQKDHLLRVAMFADVLESAE